MKLLNLWTKTQNQATEFERLLSPHIEHLYKLAYRFCGQQSDAEDLVQELLVKLYPKTQEISHIENLKPWLDKTLYHLFIDQKRKASRSPVDLKNEDLTENLENEASLPNHQTTSQEDDRFLQQVAKALLTLNPDQRSLIVMHDLEGYTLSELENLLATPIGTLKSRLSRARGKLKASLAEPNITTQRYKQMRG